MNTTIFSSSLVIMYNDRLDTMLMKWNTQVYYSLWSLLFENKQLCVALIKNSGYLSAKKLTVTGCKPQVISAIFLTPPASPYNIYLL